MKAYRWTLWIHCEQDIRSSGGRAGCQERSAEVDIMLFIRYLLMVYADKAARQSSTIVR
jgi:hypothetical protein